MFVDFLKLCHSCCVIKKKCFSLCITSTCKSNKQSLYEVYLSINIRENRMENQAWTLQRH